LLLATLFLPKLDDISLIKQYIAFLCTLNGHGRVIDCGQISHVVIQDTYAKHVLMHSDSLGFLDYLLYVEMLLLSSISKEDAELVELDAVMEGKPRLHAKIFV
jgi:hypothetical protein